MRSGLYPPSLTLKWLKEVISLLPVSVGQFIQPETLSTDIRTCQYCFKIDSKNGEQSAYYILWCTETLQLLTLIQVQDLIQYCQHVNIIMIIIIIMHFIYMRLSEHSRTPYKNSYKTKPAAIYKNIIKTSSNILKHHKFRIKIKTYSSTVKINKSAKVELT